MKYEWIKSIPEFEKYFGDDHRLIIDMVGTDNYLKLLEHFSKTGIYFGSASINALKKEWTLKNKEVPPNEAARTLDVSTKTIYNWRQEAGPDNYDLFEEEE